jgi:cation/acetate symporter
MIAQMVGAGKLIQLIFGIDYVWAVVSVSALMVIYVTAGGMLATTWVQIIKAALLVLGGLMLAILVLAQFGFNLNALFSAAQASHAAGDDVVRPGLWLGDPLAVLTTALTMAFGILGLPHILMRFFTVKDAPAARSSVVIATTLMGFFYLLILIIGFGAIGLLAGQGGYFDEAGRLIGGPNMVALNVSHLLGGEAFMGFMAAVTFATILAVVAGLTLSGSAAIAHDLYGEVILKGRKNPKSELWVSRVAALGLGAFSLILGLSFEDQNVAVIASLALALAASVNFPILLLAMYWSGLTTRGTMWGGGLTLAFSVGLIMLSPSIWDQALGLGEAPMPYTYPTVFSMPLGFLLTWLFSVTDKSARAQEDRRLFKEQFFQAETGLKPDQVKLAETAREPAE